MSKLAAFLIAGFVLVGVCQAPSQVDPPAEKYVIESAGRDVHDALHSLFTQAKRNYILDPKVRFTLYLSVRDIDFEKGLAILMDQAKLQYEIRDGIYYIAPMGVTVAGSQPAGSPKAEFDWKPVLARKIVLSKKHAALRSIAESLARQSGVPVRVDPHVPQCLLNVEFNDVTVKYGLDNITKAAKLCYEASPDGVIRISLIDAGTTSQSIEETHKANVKPAAALKCPSCGGALGTGWKYCPYCGYWVKPITMKK